MWIGILIGLLLSLILAAISVALGRKGDKNKHEEHSHEETTDREPERRRERERNRNQEEEPEPEQQEQLQRPRGGDRPRPRPRPAGIEGLDPHDDPEEEKNDKDPDPKDTEDEEVYVAERILPGELSEETWAAIHKAEAYYKQFQAGHESERAAEIATNKINSMTSINPIGDKNEHDEIVSRVVINEWEEQYDQRALNLYTYLHGMYTQQYPPEYFEKQAKESPLLEEHIEASDDLIILTSEKYNYYSYFIKNKGEELISKLGKDDPRIKEITDIVAKVRGEVEDSKIDLDSFLIHSEEELQKLEKIEKTLITKKEAKQKNAVTGLVQYQKELVEGKGNNGKTVEELIDEKIRRMQDQGLIELEAGNDKLRPMLIEGAKKAWQKRALLAEKKTTALIQQAGESKDCRKLLEDKPTENLEKWIQGSDFRVLISQTVLKYVHLRKFSEKIMSEIAQYTDLPDSFYDKFNEGSAELVSQVIDDEVPYDTFVLNCSSFEQAVNKKVKEIMAQVQRTYDELEYEDKTEKREEKGLVVASSAKK